MYCVITLCASIPLLLWLSYILLVHVIKPRLCCFISDLTSQSFFTDIKKWELFIPLCKLKFLSHIIFLLPKKYPLIVLIVKAWWWWIISAFVFLKKHSLIFSERVFAGCGMWVDNSSPLQYFKDCLLASTVSDRSLFLCICVPFPLVAFTIFLLITGFQEFDYYTF